MWWILWLSVTHSVILMDGIMLSGIFLKNNMKEDIDKQDWPWVGIGKLGDISMWIHYTFPSFLYMSMYGSFHNNNFESLFRTEKLK